MPGTRWTCAAAASLAGAAVIAACAGAARHAAAVSVPVPVPLVATFGHSTLGHPLVATETGRVRGARADILVVGCIHGDEPAGIAVTRLLRRELAGRRVDAWLVDSLNPDGRARHTRQNARGVDLNRNFPWHWQPLGPRGTQQYSGTHALSEPESRAAYRLIRRIRPRVAIWFHQPLGVVDESGGRLDVERRFSRLSGLPLRRLTRYPGSVTSWENTAVPGSSAFVVELPPGRLAPRRANALARAVTALALRPGG